MGCAHFEFVLVVLVVSGVIKVVQAVKSSRLLVVAAERGWSENGVAGTFTING